MPGASQYRDQMAVIQIAYAPPAKQNTPLTKNNTQPTSLPVLPANACPNATTPTAI